MNILSNSVYRYYFSHFDELTLDKQFHFVSRLYAVCNDKQAKEKLLQLQAPLIGNNTALQVLSTIQSGAMFPLLPGNAELLQARAPYIEKYPQLRDTSRLLYWSAMLSYAYQFESKEALTSLIPSDDLEDLYQDLLRDHSAVATLSTHAVNYLYVYKRFYKHESGPDPSLFSTILSNQSHYDYSDPVQLRLAVYMVTHAIIADTVFYFEPVPKDHVIQHRNNLEQLETILTNRLDLLSLDTKLEFILCCKLVGRRSTLESDIINEVNSNISESGTFITSGNRMNDESTVQNSEHRNALYLMLLSLSG